MKLEIREGLPFAVATLAFRGKQIELANSLIDTGSAGTIFSIDLLLTIGLQYEADDMVHRIRGVGGTEFVFTKQVDQLSLGELALHQFEIEIGAMDYGFALDGIIGMDFLTQVRAVIDLEQLEIYQSNRSDNLSA